METGLENHNDENGNNISEGYINASEGRHNTVESQSEISNVEEAPLILN